MISQTAFLQEGKGYVYFKTRSRGPLINGFVSALPIRQSIGMQSNWPFIEMSNAQCLATGTNESSTDVEGHLQNLTAKTVTLDIVASGSDI